MEKTFLVLPTLEFECLPIPNPLNKYDIWQNPLLFKLNRHFFPFGKGQTNKFPKVGLV